MSLKKILTLTVVAILVGTIGVFSYIIENIFTIQERTAKMSLKPIKSGVDKKFIHEGVVYSKRDYSNEVDVYAQPENKNAGIVIILYGGYWQGGLPGNYKHLAGIANRAGHVAVVPEIPAAYGVVGRLLLGKESISSRQHPAQLNALIELVQWLNIEAEKYGGDPKRISLLGIGSGSQSALLLALRGDLQRQAGMAGHLKGVIAINLIADLTVKHDTFNNMYVKPVFGENRQTLQLASPITHLNKEAPPIMIIAPEFEPDYMKVGAEKFTEQMGALNLKVDYHKIEQRAPKSIVFKTGRRGDPVRELLKKFWAEKL